MIDSQTQHYSCNVLPCDLKNRNATHLQAATFLRRSMIIRITANIEYRVFDNDSYAIASRCYRMPLRVCLSEHCFYTPELHLQTKIVYGLAISPHLNIAFCRLKLDMHIEVNEWVCIFVSLILAFAKRKCICKNKSGLVCKSASQLFCQTWQVQQIPNFGLCNI